MEGGAQVEDAADWINSIETARIPVLVLDFGDKGGAFGRTAGSGNSWGKIDLLDKPLWKLAGRVRGEMGRRLTMVLAANNSFAIVARLPEFRKVGNIWCGERAIDNKYERGCRWSFLAATESECREVDKSVLEYCRV